MAPNEHLKWSHARLIFLIQHNKTAKKTSQGSTRPKSQQIGLEFRKAFRFYCHRRVSLLTIEIEDRNHRRIKMEMSIPNLQKPG